MNLLLVVPHLSGEALPVTTWNTDKSKLSVSWNDQITNLGFTVTNSLTKVSLLTTDLQPLKQGSNSFSIQPNPAKSVVSIKNAENCDLKVFNSVGRIVFQKKSLNTTYQFSVTNWVKGNYLVRIEKQHEIAESKLLLIK